MVCIVSCAYGGPVDFDFDKSLDKLVGRKHSNAGAGFGERDLAWLFRTGPSALKAFQRLRRAMKSNELHSVSMILEV